MRAFTKMRQIFIENQKVIEKIKELDKKYEKYLTKHGAMIMFHETMVNSLSREIEEINKKLTPQLEESKNEIGFRDRKNRY